MTSKEMKSRTKSFALRVIKLVRTLDNRDLATNTIARQIIRSGTSVASNYRAACISKSRTNFVYKMRVCAEEADETKLWLELLTESDLIYSDQVAALNQEAQELTNIFLSSLKTAKDGQSPMVSKKNPNS